MKSQILLVDDEANIIASLKRVLFDEPYKVLAAQSGEEGLDIFKKYDIKVVISDEKMPGMSGADFLSLVKRRNPDTIRMMLTGNASIDAVMKAVNSGEIYRFLTKPWNDIELKLAIRSAVEKYDLEQENMRLLKTVKRQAAEIKAIEKSYPGITKLERDEDGNLVIPEISDEEYSKILTECKRRFS